MLASKPKPQAMDVPKPKAFKGARSAIQFYPEYAEDKAQAKLRRLMQPGRVREYVQEFSELMLRISDLSEKEAFFLFTDGLKPWAK
ncbi:hypothetical protein Gotur_014159 [Gossypium turneri]